MDLPFSVALRSSAFAAGSGTSAATRRVGVFLGITIDP
jgi:hypothetical protein